MLWLGVAILTAAWSTLGCAPVVEVPDGPPPKLPEGAAPPLDGCNAPLLVPTGFVGLGPMIIEGGTGHYDTCGDEDPGTAGFVVSDVFLDVDEVTNRCYRHCVDSGACLPPVVAQDPDAPEWIDPAAADFPAIVDQPRAAAFCAFRGGRMAAIAELARAAQGEALSIGQPELLHAWAECFEQDFESPDCAALALQAHDPGLVPLRPARPIRSETRDVGPFGHFDVWGSQAELSMTQFDWYPDEWCTHEGAAPLTFSNDPNASYCYYMPGFTLATNYFAVVAEPAVSKLLVNFACGDSSFAPRLQGVRCAYDVAQ
jgi:hypothetical protein